MVLHPPARPRQGKVLDGDIPRLYMTCHPSVKGVPFANLADHYGVLFFRDTLKRFIVEHTSPVPLTRPQVERASATIYFPFSRVPVWHRVKFTISNPYEVTKHIDPILDVAHARPAWEGKYGAQVPGQFDTVLVNDGSGGVAGIAGMLCIPD